MIGGIVFLVSGLIMLLLGGLLNMNVSVFGIRIGFGLIGMGLILLTVGATLRGLADSIGIVWYTVLMVFVGIGIGAGLISFGLADNIIPALASSNSTGVHWG